MKKLLLSLAVTLSAFALNAAPVTVDFASATTLPTAEAQGQSFTVDGVDFTADYCKKGTYSQVSYLAVQGKNNTGANFAFKLSYACENITIHTGASASTNVTVQLSANGVNVGSAVKLDTKDGDFTFTIPAESQAAGTEYKFTVTNKYNAQVSSLVFNKEVDPVVPVDPVDPQGDGTEANPYNVTAALAVATALDENGKVAAYTKGTVKAISDLSTSYGNATYTITDGYSTLSVFRGYYLNGDKFTAADQLKVGDEVLISGDLVNYKGNTPQYTTGSKLITINGQGKPDVAAVNVANIAAFLALDANAKAKFTSPVTVLYQNGNYLYIHDNTGNVLVYGNLGKTYTPGMTIAAGFEGTVGEFNGLKQVVPVADTFADGVAGTAVEPEVYQIEEIASDMAYAYVKFIGVTIEGADRNFTMTDESGTLALYQQFTNVDVLTGAGKIVTGFVGQHKNGQTYDIQVLPVSVTNASGRESVETPVFTPGAGAVLAGTEVTITCPTEGATIYYTLDGTQPNASSSVYNAPIAVNEAMTITALAVKEGLDDSAVATAAYTIKEPVVIVGNTATFDFTDPSTLDPAYSKADAEADGTTGNLKIDLPKEGFAFMSNGIELSTVASGNAARIYCQKPDTENEAWSYRIYKNSVTTISCQAGYKIEKVEFTTQTTSYATALGKCTFSDNVVYADGVVTPATNGATPAVVTSFTITNPAGSAGATIGFSSIVVTFANASGIADVEVDANAPVEFYNLQGVRMQGELTPGLYIRRQGNTATKVIVK